MQRLRRTPRPLESRIVADVLRERPRLTREEWFAKREAKRQRQREQNVHRAAKMRAARLAHEAEHGDASHAPDPAASKPGFRVGCSGWFYWHWRQCFYPPGSPTNAWFNYYASQFKTVELNAPFYSWPTVGTVETWRKQPGRRRFTYTVKVCELITHEKRLAGTATLVRDFYHIAHLLGPRLDCFLFQLPPSFHYSPAALKRIVAQLDARHRNVVEFRHRSWWRPRVYDALRDAGLIFCSCSGPRLPEELVETTEQDVYVRFHGTKQWYRHDYTTEELAVWVKRIKESGATRVWAYFNNDRNGYAIKNARTLLRLLKGGVA
jgi:uncharacterized protein YecE (DUF72 family)